MQNTLNQIKSVFKEEITDYKSNEQGCSNFVVEVNNEWIFRFVRSIGDLSQFELEKEFLLSFEKISPIQVPKIEYVGKDFIGYKKIKGEQLSSELFLLLSQEIKENTYKKLAFFLKTLHSFEFEHENLVEFPLGDGDFWGDIWNNVEYKLDENTRKKAYKYFVDYFETIKNQKIDKVICHSDFHPNHIIFDKNSGDISGIIDFGRLSLHDRAIDFNLIERFYGKEALKGILKYYQLESGENFEKRIEYENKRRLFSALYFAIKNNNQEDLSRYIERIEKEFN